MRLDTKIAYRFEGWQIEQRYGFSFEGKVPATSSHEVRWALREATHLSLHLFVLSALFGGLALGLGAAFGNAPVVTFQATSTRLTNSIAASFCFAPDLSPLLPSTIEASTHGRMISMLGADVEMPFHVATVEMTMVLAERTESGRLDVSTLSLINMKQAALGIASLEHGDLPVVRRLHLG